MKKIKLGELFKIQSGFAFKSGDIKSDGIPIIRIGNIQNNLVIVDNNYCYNIDFLNNKKNNNYIISKGDLLIAMSGATTGKVGIYPYEKEALLNQRVGKFINLGSEINLKYLYYVLQSPKFKRMITQKAVGCAQPNISNKDIEAIELPFYSNEEKKSIVEELNYLYKLIDNRKKQIIDLKQLIHNYYEINFGKYQIVKEIGELCTIKARIGWQGLTKKEYLKDGPCYLITGVDFVENRINFNNCYCVTEERYKQDENIQIHKTDVLVTKDGTIGKVAYINEEPNKPTTLNSGVFVIRPKEITELNSIFLEYSLMSEKFSKFIDNIKTGATISHLNQEAFLKYKIPLASKQEQECFAKYGTLIEKNISICEKNICDLQKIITNKMHVFFD